MPPTWSNSGSSLTYTSSTSRRMAAGMRASQTSSNSCVSGRTLNKNEPCAHPDDRSSGIRPRERCNCRPSVKSGLRPSRATATPVATRSRRARYSGPGPDCPQQLLAVLRQRISQHAFTLFAHLLFADARPLRQRNVPADASSRKEEGGPRSHASGCPDIQW